MNAVETYQATNTGDESADSDTEFTEYPCQRRGIHDYYCQLPRYKRNEGDATQVRHRGARQHVTDTHF